MPPNIQRGNTEERAIQPFKNIFLAGIATCNPKFPINEWDRLLKQAEITLTLLRQARQNTKLSAYAYLFGPYNYNKNPMAPPGTKVIVHKKHQIDYPGIVMALRVGILVQQWTITDA